MSADMGSILGNVANLATLGLYSAVDSLLINKPEMPQIPEGPDTIQTGQMVQTKGTSTLVDTPANAESAREVARKGNTQYRIPLSRTTTGAKTAGGSGLKI